jgi:hypothetical protein
MIDGEKMGLESSRRKNHDRKLPEDRIIGRKKIGRKLDLIARDVVDRQEWLVVERMKMWDTLSRKYLKECNHDLFREMATICRNRLEESKDSTFKNEAQFFGVYTGGKHNLELFMQSEQLLNLSLQIEDLRVLSFDLLVTIALSLYLSSTENMTCLPRWEILKPISED